MKKPPLKSKNDESPEQVSERESLERMKRFVERKELFVNAVKAGKDRGLSAGQKR